MNTAEALEKITDRGKFELLVTSVLRKHNRDYAAIIHTGINAQGETIKSPVDGFCRVPRTVPPRYLLVQHATTDRNQLEKKWLHDHTTVKARKNDRKTQPSESDDGDLLKAGQEAKRIKTKFPDAQCTVILATNQHLPQGIELITKVEEKAATLGVDVDIWEQSKIADFLDSTPEGQWLRKEYLGVNAEMLSESLLGDLCKQSLANYQKEYIPSPDSLVPREIDIKVEKGTYSNTYTIQLLIGESGSGKSVAAYQLLKKYIESGGYGLWVSDSVANGCNSLQNLLDRVLQNLYPSLLPDAGSSVLQFIPESSQLLLIVDDVNRTDNPTRLVQKLINWFKPQQSGTSDSKPVFSPYLLVCPVWSKVSSPISLDFKEKHWINPVFINSMNSEEGMAAIQSVTSLAGRDITNTEAASLATKLGNDPILIGLFYELLLSNAQPYELERFTENIIERFIITTLSESSNSGTFLENEYRASLSTVATQMLTRGKLYPLWTDIREWLWESPDKLAALRELIKHKALCRLTKEDKFLFRHDRIREALLVESMIKLLADTTPDSDILYEPFYAEIIGQAIARSPQSKEFLRELRNRLPLALVEAIQCFSTPTNDYYHQAILEEIKEWVNNSVATGFIPESVLDAVCWSLLEINSPAVIEITDNFPAYRPVLLARLRNGCAVSGVHYCINENRHYFAPFTEDSVRDQALEQAKHYHKEKLLKELKQLLTSDVASDEERKGTLTLAGFLCFSELEDEIAVCWELVTDKARILPIAIWAATQCCGVKPKKLLDPLMAFWAELPDEKDKYGVSWKNWFLDQLRFSMTRNIRDDVVDYLIDQCSVYESLRQHIVHMCELIDKPNSVEFIVRSFADMKRDLAGTNRVLAWMPEREFVENLSQPSINRLEALLENPSSDNFIKQYASYLLPTSAEDEPIDILRATKPNSFHFFNALWKHAKLGDYSVVPDILPLVEEDTKWFYIAPHIWCEEFLSITERHLEAFKRDIPTDFSACWLLAHHDIANLLTMIPAKDAEMLLDKYWKHLGYSSLFIQTALYIGTPKCLELAEASLSKPEASLNECPHSVPVINHLFTALSHHYDCQFTQSGFIATMTDKHEHWTVQRLENLIPYLDRLGESQVWQLAEVCRRIGIPQWSQKNLYSRLSEEHRKRYHPSDDDLLQDLNEFAAQENGIRRVDHWLEEFDKRHDPKSRALSLVDCWLAFNPTVRGLQIAAACIQSMGTRRNLSILDQYIIEGSPDEIARIKESTRFAVYRRSLD